MLFSRLFDFFRPTASLLAVEHARLVLRSEKPLPTGAVRVKVAVGQPGGTVRTLKRTVEVESVRRLSHGGYACVGKCQDWSPEDRPVSREAVAGIRRSPRHDCGIRAFSPQLPGFQGILLDFSTVGARLKTVGGLEEGTRLTLYLDTNLGELPRIEVQVRVAWCRRIDGSHQMGLEFTELSGTCGARVERFARFLEERRGSSLFHRALGV